MQSEIHAYERTKQRSMNEVMNSINKIKDPIERLKGKIDGILWLYNLYSDINEYTLKNKIDSLPVHKAESLNAVALIFSLYVINNYEIDKKILDDIFSSKRFDEALKKDNVSKIDIIRYARFWISTEKKN